MAVYKDLLALYRHTDGNWSLEDRLFFHGLSTRSETLGPLDKIMAEIRT